MDLNKEMNVGFFTISGYALRDSLDEVENVYDSGKLKQVLLEVTIDATARPGGEINRGLTLHSVGNNIAESMRGDKSVIL